MIDKLVGREKVVWTTVSSKVNEIIDYLNRLEKEAEEEQKKDGISK